MKNSSMNLDCINIIKGLSYSQMFLQDEKSTLINSGYFNDEQAFAQIDSKGTSKILPSDLIDYLSVHRIAASERECQYLIWNAGSSETFLTYAHFKTYITNGHPELLDKMQNSVISNANNNADQIMKSYSQRELAKIFEKELQYYRAIELLREDFIKKHGYQFKTVISNIDRERRGNIVFDALIRFIHENGVEFSIEEFQALCRKIRAKQYDCISIKEMLRALSPFEPLSFPTYRKQSNIQKAMEYINEEVEKLQINTQYLPPQMQDGMTQPRKTSTGFQKVVDHFRDTANKGIGNTNKYFYDKNYYNELRQYKTNYVDPNKDHKKKQQSNVQSLIGPQYHDHFFADYYLHLDERNKTEHYYNKFGKRYTFENPLSKTMDAKY